MDRRTKNWAWGMALFFGVPLTIASIGHYEETQDARPIQVIPTSAANVCGPSPEMAELKADVLMVLRHEANDPDSVQIPELGDPVADKRAGVSCWRVPFHYRAKNGFGALVLKKGAAWVKDGKTIHLSFD